MESLCVSHSPTCTWKLLLQDAVFLESGVQSQFFTRRPKSDSDWAEAIDKLNAFCYDTDPRNAKFKG